MLSLLEIEHSVLREQYHDPRTGRDISVDKPKRARVCSVLKTGAMQDLHVRGLQPNLKDMQYYRMPREARHLAQ